MENLDLLAEKIYLHFMDVENRSYPLLLEKEEIKKSLEKTNKSLDSFYFLDKIDDEIQGICSYYINKEDKYIQTEIFVSFNHNEGFINKVLSNLIESYPDYTIDVGVEACNSLLIDELQKKGFKIMDDLYSASIKVNESNYSKYPDIESIDKAKWDLFKKIHQQYFAEEYWTFDRIKENFDIWKIYSINDGQQIKAYIFIKTSLSDETCEIFGIYSNSLEEGKRLMEHALASLNDKEIMYYFIEDEKEVEACQKLGFTIHGHYRDWQYKK